MSFAEGLLRGGKSGVEIGSGLNIALSDVAGIVKNSLGLVGCSADVSYLTVRSSYPGNPSAISL